MIDQRPVRGDRVPGSLSLLCARRTWMAAPSIRTGTAPKTLSAVKCWVRGVHPIILFGIQTTQRLMRRSDRSVIAQWPVPVFDEDGQLR